MSQPIYGCCEAASMYRITTTYYRWWNKHMFIVAYSKPQRCLISW